MNTANEITQDKKHVTCINFRSTNSLSMAWIQNYLFLYIGEIVIEDCNIEIKMIYVHSYLYNGEYIQGL